MKLVSIIRNSDPDLEGKRAEELALEALLRERESELAALQLGIREFELAYLETLGSKYDELADIERQIADVFGQESSDDDYQIGSEIECGQTKFHASEGLKKLYREVARLCHPDLADNELDRLHRHELMTVANDAYESQSEERLRSLLNAEAQIVELSQKGSREVAQVVRAVRLLEEELARLDAEVERLRTSEMQRLKLRSDRAREAGHDFLQELVGQVERQIRKSRNRLDTLRAEVKLTT